LSAFIFAISLAAASGSSLLLSLSESRPRLTVAFLGLGASFFTGASFFGYGFGASFGLKAFQAPLALGWKTHTTEYQL